MRSHNSTHNTNTHLAPTYIVHRKESLKYAVGENHGVYLLQTSEADTITEGHAPCVG